MSGLSPIWPDIHRFDETSEFISVMFSLVHHWQTLLDQQESPTCERFRCPNLTSCQIQFCPDTCKNWPENVWLLDVIVSTAVRMFPTLNYVMPTAFSRILNLSRSVLHSSCSSLYILYILHVLLLLLFRLLIKSWKLPSQWASGPREQNSRNSLLELLE